MFSLDAMTRGQHAISTASLASNGHISSSVSSLASSTTSVASLHQAGPRRSSGRKSSRSKSKSATTVEMDTNSLFDATQPHARYTTSNNNDQLQQNKNQPGDESISLYHEDRASSQLPLKDQQKHQPERRLSDSFDYLKPKGSLSRNNDDFMIRSHPSGLSSGDPSNTEHHESGLNGYSKAGKFRYVVATLIILGVTLSAYASNTMYIAAIEMISNDVLQSGMTSLRAKHLSNDPLATNKNAALPGTCPKEAAHQSRVAALIQAKLLTLMNASEISSHERQAMQADTLALHQDIDERLARGQLVDWTINQRGYIFTAHNIGTILLAVPVSRLGLIYGSKTMIFWCIFLSAARMLCLPTLAGYAPFWATFFFEMLIGGIGGNIIILGYPIAAAWLLPDEANFFVAINVLSTMIGIAATNFLSTQLLAADLSWCWCYYLPGILLLALAILWFIWGADRPELSSFVKRAELELLQSNTIAKRNASELANYRAQQAGATESMTSSHGNQDDEREALLFPSKQQARAQNCRCPQMERDSCPANKFQRKPNWAIIFTCPTVWALILVAFANHWTTKNATLWPTFFSNILHLESSTIGIMLGIKGVWALVFGSIFAIATRKLIVNRPFNMSLTAYRRWNQAIATSLYSVSVALIIFMDCEILTNFAALMIQPLVSSFNSISADQLPLDMSAEDSGLLVSVVRLISVGDIFALPVSSFILSYAPNALAGDRHTWRLVWSIGLLTRVLSSLYFILVAKSRPKNYTRLEPEGTCKSPLASMMPTTLSV